MKVGENMNYGFIRVCAATPEIAVGDVQFNTKNIIKMIFEAEKNCSSIIVFPEFAITSATLGDLFYSEALICQAQKALFDILEATKKLNIVIIVGLPFRLNDGVYNCSAVLLMGEILGMVPFSLVGSINQSYSEFPPKEILIDSITSVFSDRLVFVCKNFPQFSFLIRSLKYGLNSVKGNSANIICVPDASPHIVGSEEFTLSSLLYLSKKTHVGYIYAGAGKGESTTDMVFSGLRIIAENGKELSRGTAYSNGITYADVDIERISSEKSSAEFHCKDSIYIEFDMNLPEFSLDRNFSMTPFIPDDKTILDNRCNEILAIQAHGLAKRLEHTRVKSAVIGLSGGLDSTLALIVTARAFEIISLDKSKIFAVTMPCFGTSARTRGNAERLAAAIGATFKEIDISNSVRLHFSDIGQDENNLDTAFENAQARERTQVLMDLANIVGGLVIGTGDLSELALGFATYNGDHMSMYGVNADIPKTLMRKITAYAAENADDNLKNILMDIISTPVSPELLPPDSDGEISQKTEDVVGPYELHDFFLYYFLRFGFSPKKILFLAKIAFSEVYNEDIIKKWLKMFIKRFFTSQFKRSCLPDGPKIGRVCISPRGSFSMPSDAVAKVWLAELDSDLI